MLDAVIRLFTRKTAGVADLRLTEYEALAVSQQQMPFEEETRAGWRYALGFKTAITGIAPVQTIPTTAAQWGIWNADQVKSMIIDEIGAVLVSGVAGAGIQVFATLFQTPSQDAVVMNAGLGIQSLNGGGGGGAVANSSARVVSAVTLSQPATTYWFQVAEALTLTTAILSTAAINRTVGGKIIIPPKMGLALVVCSPTGTTPLFAPHAIWTEKALSNE